MANKPKKVKGTRDFLPSQTLKRKYLFNTIEKHFKRFGFQPIETPAMEELKTLTGKYGEEGDRLIFKILNSGDFKAKVSTDEYADIESSKLAHRISDKALRYDLTVPFARFVVNNQNDLSFPFRRYQIQPVWRADRPQKGRYREFFQCDADIIGSKSLLLEVELTKLYFDVLTEFKIPGFVISLNNRKILSGLSQVLNAEDKFRDLTVAIDKLDKIGVDKVLEELAERGFDAEQQEKVKAFLSLTGSSEAKLNELKNLFVNNEVGLEGISELEFVLKGAKQLGVKEENLNLDPTLARGLDYYTGAIFEVKVPEASVGSICGGGRYDDLTGIFGLPNMPGIGISFGADRIYDVLEEFDLFPKESMESTQVLFVLFDEEDKLLHLQLAQTLRDQGISAEIYPEAAKLKKQMKYANDKNIKHVVLIGESEKEEEMATVKNMESGEQNKIAFSELAKFF